MNERETRLKEKLIVHGKVRCGHWNQNLDCVVTSRVGENTQAFFGFFFEQKNTYKRGDIISFTHNDKGTVEAIL